jgi:hypothetical protein
MGSPGAVAKQIKRVLAQLQVYHVAGRHQIDKDKGTVVCWAYSRQAAIDPECVKQLIVKSGFA